MDLIFTGNSLKDQHTGQPLFHPIGVIPKAGVASRQLFLKRFEGTGIGTAAWGKGQQLGQAINRKAWVRKGWERWHMA